MTALKLQFLLICLTVTPFWGEASLSTTSGSSQCCSLEGLRGGAHTWSPPTMPSNSKSGASAAMSKSEINTNIGSTNLGGASAAIKNDSTNLGSGPPGYPNTIIYPEKGRGLSKPLPKASLYKTNNPKDPVNMAWSAKAWILNVIELFHWISFPIGFYLFWTMFENSGRLAAAIGGKDPILGVFFLLLSHGKYQATSYRS